MQITERTERRIATFAILLMLGLMTYQCSDNIVILNYTDLKKQCEAAGGQLLDQTCVSSVIELPAVEK